MRRMVKVPPTAAPSASPEPGLAGPFPLSYAVGPRISLLCFRKGHWVLGLIGFIFPVLWVIGAILPSRRYR